MQPELILSSLITILLSVVGYSLIRVHKGIDKHAELLIEQTKALSSLGSDLRIMGEKMEHFQSTLRMLEHDSTRKREEMSETIELVRARIHSLSNKVQSLYIHAGINGWKIKSEEEDNPR